MSVNNVFICGDLRAQFSGTTSIAATASRNKSGVFDLTCVEDSVLGKTLQQTSATNCKFYATRTINNEPHWRGASGFRNQIELRGFVSRDAQRPGSSSCASASSPRLRGRIQGAVAAIRFRAIDSAILGLTPKARGCRCSAVKRQYVITPAKGCLRPDQVILVDDNSNRNQQAEIVDIARRHDFLYRRLPTVRTRLEKLGRRSMARNMGSKSLDTDVVLYLDGDMMLSPGYIEEVVKYHSELDKVYVRARRFEISSADQDRGIEHCLRITRSPRLSDEEERNVDYATQPPETRDLVHGDAYLDRWEWMASNNLSVKRSHVIEVGLWDEAFIGWGEEDMEFSYRLYKHGLQPIIVKNKQAVAFHIEHHIDPAAKGYMLKRNAEYFLSKFPEVIPQRRESYKLHGLDIEELSAIRTVR